MTTTLTRPARLGWALLALAACDVVDETGWVCLDGTVVDDPQQCMERYEDMESSTDTPDGGDPPFDDGVPGAAEADESLLLYTSAEPLSDAPVMVTVIGLPGFNPSGQAVTLAVDGGRELEAQVDGSSFVGLVFARQGSIIDVRVAGDTAAALQLEATVPAPDVGVPPESPLTEDDVDTAGGINSDAPREVAVGDGQLAFPAPYVVYNQTSGQVVSVQQGSFEAYIEVWPGDVVCVVAIAPGDAIGAPICQTW